MQMVRVYDLQPADHAERSRIPQIRARNGGCRIAERVGPIPLRLIRKSDQMCLLLQPFAMGFAAIIEEASRWSVGIGMGIALRQHVPLTVQQSERLVPCLMIKNHE